ncbi:hypothetical protein [uncultured Sphaerochaeta sp.]|uniref:hypothetical protein n=1 Tax=uncultured Sphaerochaeta sp. TaxID=886478 RepID=UPI002A0A34F6|nr:hypothetical protein [uncultured Sphaerochaeta sp.]
MVFQNGTSRLRHAIFAGSWYPREDAELELLISNSLQESKTREKQGENGLSPE